MNRRSLSGTGYQFRQTPCFCRAAAIEAGDVAPSGGSSLWFWLLAAGALGLALLAPKGARS